MPPSSIEEVFLAFKRLKVLVIGDAMLDIYQHGIVERMSPEDQKVPVLRIHKEEQCLGGAANVVLNLDSLGCETTLIAPVGVDASGNCIRTLLIENGLTDSGLFISHSRKTTTKTRVFDSLRQIVRIDQEHEEDISKTEQELLLKEVESRIEEADLILLQDYNKGCLTKSVIKKLIELARLHSCQLAVDPKYEQAMDYIGVSLFKPNLSEFSKIIGVEQLNPTIEDLHPKALSFIQKQGIHRIIISLSEDGMFYLDENGSGIHPAHKRNLVDVSGAGDVVFVIAALCTKLGLSASFSAELANVAGGISCETQGAQKIDVQFLLQEEGFNKLLKLEFA